MIINKIGKNTISYTFDNIKDYDTNVFLIEKTNKIYLIDTYCGSQSMEEISKYIKSKNKKLIVINSHFHWDHIWGNIAFKNEDIISHKLCRDFIEKYWDKEFENNKIYIQGKCEKILPNITFNDTLSFPEDGIEIFHSPGHSDDSITVYDSEDKILYVGDNIERPIIYFEGSSIDKYLETLNRYKSINTNEIHGSHSLNLTNKDINKTIAYLEKLKANTNLKFKSEYEEKIHLENIERLLRGDNYERI